MRSDVMVKKEFIACVRWIIIFIVLFAIGYLMSDVIAELLLIK